MKYITAPFIILFLLCLWLWLFITGAELTDDMEDM
jgi:hypothetical protein